MSTIPQRRAECSTPRSSPDETRVKSRCWHVTSRRPRVCRRYAGRLAIDSPAAERLQDTTGVFLRTGGSYVQTSEELVLHRTTVKYRLHTGTTLRADEPVWIDWTHNALAFALLRGAEAFGLDLTPAEQDKFVVEQHIAAELVGADPARLPATRADLEA
nr:oxygenase MpaB family protein [Rhodococcus pyridinivorans]